MTILEPKQEKKYFFCKMLNFQDFSKFSKILKFTVQYLSRDISNVKIGQFLRQSRKKHWKTLFGPTAFKIKKIKKFDIPSHKFFQYLSSKKKILKIGPPQVGVWGGVLAVVTLICPYLYLNNNIFLLQICTWCPKINATFETPGIQSIFKIFTKFQKEYNSFKWIKEDEI